MLSWREWETIENVVRHENNHHWSLEISFLFFTQRIRFRHEQTTTNILASIFSFGFFLIFSRNKQNAERKKNVRNNEKMLEEKKFIGKQIRSTIAKRCCRASGESNAQTKSYRLDLFWSSIDQKKKKISLIYDGIDWIV